MNEFNLFDDIDMEEKDLFAEEELDLFSEELEDRVNACASSFACAGTPTSTASCLTTVCSLIPIC